MLSRTTTTLVVGGSLHMVDYVIVDRPARRFQSQPKLLDHGEDGRTVWIGLRLVGIGSRWGAGAPRWHVDVEPAGDTRAIDDCAIEEDAEGIGEIAHFGVAQSVASGRAAALNSARSVTTRHFVYCPRAAAPGGGCELVPFRAHGQRVDGDVAFLDMNSEL